MWIFGPKKYYFPNGQKTVKKFPPNFHFQEWKIVKICTFLSKICKNLHFLGKKGSKSALLLVKTSPTIFFPSALLVFSNRDVLFEFHLKFWNTASIGICIWWDFGALSRTDEYLIKTEFSYSSIYSILQDKNVKIKILNYTENILVLQILGDCSPQ